MVVTLFPFEQLGDTNKTQTLFLFFHKKGLHRNLIVDTGSRLNTLPIDLRVENINSGHFITHKTKHTII